MSSATTHNSDGLILTYYGDDFTGSVDVMEALTANGVRTVLFLDVPTRDQLTAYPEIGAVGVAGISRTMSPDQMEAALPSIFEGLKSLDAPLFHYKMCSTFDSSPSVGSIGRATEIARHVFGARPLPLVVGAPILKRYCVFGNLFATADGVTYRLDRHPTMTAHPVTPMHESDLLINLHEQTELALALVDVLDLSGTESQIRSRVDRAIEEGAQVVLLDVLDERSERAVGGVINRFIRDSRGTGATQVVVGSSGVEYALAAYWRSSTDNRPTTRVSRVEPSSQTLVIAGSRAPATEAQIAFALKAGYTDVQVDPAKVTDPSSLEAARTDVVDRAVAALNTGSNVLVATPRHTVSVDGTAIARAMGEIACEVGIQTRVRRMVVAGGDTSGMVARSLGISALEILAPLTTGAPLCRVSSTQQRFDGMEICLKSGQIGAPDYFVRIAKLGSQL